MKKISLISLVLSICCLLCSCGNKDIVSPSEDEQEHTGIVLPSEDESVNKRITLSSEDECRAWPEVESLHEDDLDDLACIKVKGEAHCLIETADNKRLYFGYRDSGISDSGLIDSLRSEDEFDVYNFRDIILMTGIPTVPEYEFYIHPSDNIIIHFFNETDCFFYRCGTKSINIYHSNNLKEVEITEDKVFVRGTTHTTEDTTSREIESHLKVVTELYKE